jgi:N-acyl-D-aspartate/D-glutamate deacylase
MKPPSCCVRASAYHTVVAYDTEKAPIAVIAALECGDGFTTHLLSYRVCDKGLMSLPEAEHKLTSMLADQFGWHDRGRIQEGLAAAVNGKV